jgi:hypothetical protein
MLHDAIRGARLARATDHGSLRKRAGNRYED